MPAVSFFGGEFFGGEFFNVAAAVSAVAPRGTIALGGVRRKEVYRRVPTRKEISEARERFGLTDEIAVEAATAIAQIAARQAAASAAHRMDEQQRFEELHRELRLRGIEWDARYLEALNVQRERLIDAEIAQRIRTIREEQELLMILILLAAAA